MPLGHYLYNKIVLIFPAKEGYLVNKPEMADNFRCLVQVSDTKEGTKQYTGEPWGNDTNCDLLVITLTDGSTFENGVFWGATSYLFGIYFGHY